MSKLTQEHLKNIKIICFDCDGVTVEKGTEIIEAPGQTLIKTNKLSDQMLQKLLKLKKYFHLTFSSGRSMLYLTQMYGDVLWDNASLQSEIGTFILYQGELIQNNKFSNYELNVIKNIRQDLSKLSKNNKLVLGFEPKQFLTTLHCHQSIPEVEKIVKYNDPQSEFYCWWNQEAYDISPARITKGTGLQKLVNILELNMNNVATVGNGINDKNMTDVVGIDISTDQEHLKADFVAIGEHLGGEIVIDKLLSLLE